METDCDEGKLVTDWLVLRLSVLDYLGEPNIMQSVKRETEEVRITPCEEDPACLTGSKDGGRDHELRGECGLWSLEKTKNQSLGSS